MSNPYMQPIRSTNALRLPARTGAATPTVPHGQYRVPALLAALLHNRREPRR